MMGPLLVVGAALLNPVVRRAMIIALAIVGPPIIITLIFFKAHEVNNAPTITAIATEAATFDQSAANAANISYRNERSNLIVGRPDTISEGWWNPSTGAYQEVTTGDLTTFTVCGPSPNPGTSSRPGTCYQRHYNPADGTATGWYSKPGVQAPISLPISDEFPDDVIPNLETDVVGTNLHAATNDDGTHTVITPKDDTLTVAFTPTTATINYVTDDWYDKLTATIDNVAHEPFDTSGLVLTGDRETYDETMTPAEVRSFTDALLAPTS